MSGENTEITTLGQPENDVTAAIERLLYGNSAPEAPQEEDASEPEPKPTPAPVQEPDEDEDESPASEPSAEVEGAVLQTSELDKPLVAASPAKAPEAPKTQPEAPNNQDQLLAQLDQLIPQLQAIGANEFGDIKTPQDLWALGSSQNPEDIAKYNKFVIHQQQLQLAQARQQELRADYQRRWFQSEQVKLHRDLPEIADPVKGPALRAELRELALARGYSEQQINMASAADVMTLHDALQFRKWQQAQKAEAAKIAAAQAKAKEKAASAPPVSRPGVATDEKRNKAQERLQKVQQSGRVEDVAAYLQEIGLA